LEPDGDTEKQLKQLKRLLPTQIKVGDARPLCDRAGLLKEYAINNAALPNRKNWNLPVDAEKAKGCNGGDRLNSWLHITSSGNIVGCCQDYMETITFGNIRVNSLEQLWFSYERQLMIEHMLRTLCVKCQFSY
jgi:radical SAM protein with 4Fe4S-binding SPASM domain